jgi:hypothetical protein
MAINSCRKKIVNGKRIINDFKKRKKRIKKKGIREFGINPHPY